MKVFFDELAQNELDDASEYYELEMPGLGTQFKDEVKIGIQRILEYPTAWTELQADIRKYLLHKFPYRILY